MEESQESAAAATIATAQDQTAAESPGEQDNQVEEAPLPLRKDKDADEEDEFGDFSTTANIDETKNDGAAPIDDDFGDFGDFDSAPPAAITIPNAPGFVHVETPSVNDYLNDEIKSDAAEEQFIREILLSFSAKCRDGDAESLPKDLDDLIKAAFPISSSILDSATPSVPLFQLNAPNNSHQQPQKQLHLNENFATHDQELLDFWKILADTHIYNDASLMFQWRRSMVRTAFLESISNLKFDPFANRSGGLGSKNNSKEGLNNIAASSSKPDLSLLTTPSGSGTVNKQKPTSNFASSVPLRRQQEAAAPVKESTVDSREEELVASKKLCDIPEDEIRKMSRPELQALIASLNSSISNMQDQANYWLDSKEQLVMESEMHNKMIASLVTYAQQKHTPTTQGAKKKK